MARIAFVKVFTGLNFGIAQLSGELQRKGHETLTVYFKDFLVAPHDERHNYKVASHTEGYWVAARGRELNANLYTPFTDHEYDLLIDTLEAFRPDLIGFSMPTVGLVEASEVATRLKRHFPRVPVIFGGAGPTLEPERVMEWCDLVCVGEGEHGIIELAERIDAQTSLHGVAGIWSRKPDGEIIRPPRGPLVDIDTLATPDFEESRCVHISEGRRFVNVYPQSQGRQHYIMTQRGCPYSCSFCIESWYQDQWGKKESLRRRKVDLVIEELVQAKEKRNILGVMFYDDVFTVNPRWLREFAPKYKREVGLPFWCYTYPRTTQKEIIALLVDAGCSSMTMGIQSGSRDVLKEYNRNIDREITIRAAQIMSDTGIMCFFDLMTRSEFETHATCRETFEFLLDLPLGMRTAGFYPMQLFPRFGYTEKVQSQEKKVTLSDHDYDYYHHLYLLTRTRLPMSIKRALGRSALVRRFPRIINPLLEAKLPFFYLDNGAIDLARKVVEVTDERGERFRECLETSAAEDDRSAAPAGAAMLAGTPAGAAAE